MSYKVLQLSPQASTNGIHARTAVQDSWAAATGGSREIGYSQSGYSQFSIEDEAGSNRRPRNLISGLALSAAFSASVWSGIALIVVRVLR